MIGAILLVAGSVCMWGLTNNIHSMKAKPSIADQKGFLLELRNNAAKDERLDYLVLGDSVALGKGSAKQEGYGYRVAEYLEGEGINVHLDNRAVSGQTSEQLLQSLEDRDLLTIIGQSDLISITIGGNDLLKAALQRGDPVDALMDFRHIQRRFLDNLQAILEKIRRHNSRAPILITSLYNPVGPEEPYFPIVSKLLDQWNEGMKEVVGAFPAAAVIDVDRRLIPDDRNWLADEIHPNDWGYQLMAEGLLEVLRGKVSGLVQAR